MRPWLSKTPSAVVFLVAALASSEGPVGHLEPYGSAIYAPLIIVLCGALAVWGRLPKLSVHLAWASVGLASVLFTYRMYCYQRMNSEIYQSQLHEERKK
jgi:hypothetical protein